MFQDLEKLRNKPVTKETQKQLLEIKDKMNNNYNYIVDIVSDPKKITNLINKDKKRINNNYAKYLSGQTDRIQKIDINIPKIGEKFQSQDLFVDMSKVNPNYIMGYVDKINPTAKTLKDLSMQERAIFEANARSQNADIVADFYKKAKFAADDVEELRESISYDYAEGGRVGLAEGTTILDNLKGKGSSLLRTAERIFGPAGTAAYYAATQSVPDVTNAEELIIPAFWNMIMKQYKWSDKSTDPLKKRIINAAKRGLIPTNLMPAISRASGIGSGLMAAKYVMTESEPNVLQGKFDPEKADQVFPALIEGYEKKFTGKDESPYMDFSGGMLKMKDPDDLKMTYRNNQAMDIEDIKEEYNNGGRVGYADGPKDPSRRTVIKGLTALATLPFVGKYFKLAPKAGKIATAAIEKVKGLPDWFQPFVNKVLKVGKDVTDEAATIEREIVKRVDIEDATVDVHYNTATNDVRVEVVGGKNAFGEPLEMQYKAPEVIEETGRKTKGEFSAAESRPVQTSPDDLELDGYETDVLDDLLSETDYLEGFGTGKIRTPAEIKKAKLRAKMREDAQRDPGSLLDDFDD